MSDLGQRLRHAATLSRGPYVDHETLQRRGRLARLRMRAGSTALAVLLLSGLGAGVFEVLADRSADRVTLAQPGSSQATSPATLSGALTNPSEAVGDGEVAFYLDLTNQSREVPSVQLRVSIDGDVVVDRVMDVRDQHHVKRFPLALEPGDHTITVDVPDRDEHFTSEFTVESPTWVSVAYWGPEVPKDDMIDILVSDEEIDYQ